MKSLHQDWDVASYQKNAHFVPELGCELLKIAAPKKGELVVDLGCGDGSLTQRLCGDQVTVIGVDQSAQMVKAAKERGLDARLGDACMLDQCIGANKAHLVFSNAAMHWIKDWPLMCSAIFKTLLPGGRLVCEFGAKGNIETICNALKKSLNERGRKFEENSPWVFPSPKEVTQWLTNAHFEKLDIKVFKRDTLLKEGLEAWLRLMATPFLQSVPSEQVGDLVKEVAENTKAELFRNESWYADYVRLRLVAYKAQD